MIVKNLNLLNASSRQLEDNQQFQSQNLVLFMVRTILDWSWSKILQQKEYAAEIILES